MTSDYSVFGRAAVSLAGEEPGSTYLTRRMYNLAAPNAAPTSTPGDPNPTTDGFTTHSSSHIGLWFFPAPGVTYSYDVYRYSYIHQRWVRCRRRTDLTEADEGLIDAGGLIHRIAVHLTATTGQVEIYGGRQG